MLNNELDNIREYNFKIRYTAFRLINEVKRVNTNSTVEFIATCFDPKESSSG